MTELYRPFGPPGYDANPDATDVRSYWRVGRIRKNGNGQIDNLDDEPVRSIKPRRDGLYKIRINGSVKYYRRKEIIRQMSNYRPYRPHLLSKERRHAVLVTADKGESSDVHIQAMGLQEAIKGRRKSTKISTKDTLEILAAIVHLALPEWQELKEQAR